MMHAYRSSPVVALGFLAALTFSAPPGFAFADETIELDAAYVHGGRRSARGDHSADPVQLQIVHGGWDALVDGSAREGWERVEANTAGTVRHQRLNGGYALWIVDLDEPATMILQASGHGLAYVNGAPRAGNPYNKDWGARHPVKLHAGRNAIMFTVGRGQIGARLTPAPTEPFLDRRDVTLADVVHGEDWAVHGAIVVTNPTDAPAHDLEIIAGGDGLPDRVTRLVTVPAMSLRKVPFWYGGSVDPTRAEIELDVRLRQADRILDETTAQLRSRGRDDRHRRTFVSDIDGSVQYYSVVPSTSGSATKDSANEDTANGLILALHGAGASAEGMANTYRPKAWAHVISPTNRREFGFDWEDWGRIDALEVLAHATPRYDVDPRRVVVTGHSMGGHGTWQLGLLYPDRFAAIAPSAGWCSFATYSGAVDYDRDDPIQSILARAANASDTKTFARNGLGRGVYILHGDADDSVPPEQGRLMRDLLQSHGHQDLVYDEQAGKGHWWGGCCDWPPLMDFVAPRRVPELAQIDAFEFHTPNPAVSSRAHWLTVEQQTRPLASSAVRARLDRRARRVALETDNVSRLTLELDHLGPGTTEIVIDDAPLTADAAHPISLAHDGRGWLITETSLDLDQKGPHRAGPFKDAWRHRLVLVYGTIGNAEENAWARAKARFDAETFRYRGNGSVEVLADVDFRMGADRDRGVILYGNADTNRAWPVLFEKSPVQVRRGVVEIGDRKLEGDDLACFFVRPRPATNVACVAAVSGTGAAGMRRADRVRIFVSGFALPDVFVLGADDALDVRAAGIFGNDWSIETGSFAFAPAGSE